MIVFERNREKYIFVFIMQTKFFCFFSIQHQIDDVLRSTRTYWPFQQSWMYTLKNNSVWQDVENSTPEKYFCTSTTARFCRCCFFLLRIEIPFIWKCKRVVRSIITQEKKEGEEEEEMNPCPLLFVRIVKEMKEKESIQIELNICAWVRDAIIYIRTC